MKRLILSILLLVCVSGFSKAQQVDQFNAWYMYFGNHKLSEKYALHTEYQFRRSGFIKDWQQSLLRVGLDYKLADKSMITAGYGWIVSFPYGEQAIPLTFQEHRIFEQFVMNQNVGILYFNHRYRLEQRFLENVSLNDKDEKVHDGFRFRQRARYRFMVTIPLLNKTMEDNTLFFASYDEIFLGFGEGIASNILDQNRLYFALGWKFNNQSNVQLGYLYHRVYKTDGISRENNHTLQVALSYNFDFSKS